MFCNLGMGLIRKAVCSLGPYISYNIFCNLRIGPISKGVCLLGSFVSNKKMLWIRPQNNKLECSDKPSSYSLVYLFTIWPGNDTYNGAQCGALLVQCPALVANTRHGRVFWANALAFFKWCLLRTSPVLAHTILGLHHCCLREGWTFPRLNSPFKFQKARPFCK